MSELTKERKKLQTRLRLINYFINTKSKPTWMTIKYLPVLPPNLRPKVEINNKEPIFSDLNELYAQIINCNNRINILRKCLVFEYQIKRENNNLQEAVEKLIDNSKGNSKDKVCINFVKK